VEVWKSLGALRPKVCRTVMIELRLEGSKEGVVGVLGQEIELEGNTGQYG
jgi:predicted lysophospholipase L1 biosynthesis ABC-type transport system permease subunit